MSRPAEPETDHLVSIQRTLDRLGLTPQKVMDHKEHAVRESALSQVSDTVFTVERPRRGFSPFAFLWKLNLDTLNTNVRNALDALGIGYCYMIKSGGKVVHLGASGWAQLPGDGDIRWLFHVPMNIASVSKFMTAIATVRLLRDLRIPVTTPVAGFLPQYWTLGTGVGAITFEHLMRHESGLGGGLNPAGGFDPGPVTYRTARDQVAIGSSGTGTYDYKNINFTLLRVLFATLTGAVHPSFQFPAIPLFGGTTMDLQNDDFWEASSIAAYANYVNDVVFTTANLSQRGFDPPADAAKAYATPAATPGWVDGNTAAGAGTSGWYMSVGDLLWVLGELRRGESIMGGWRARRMMTNLYGLDEAIPTRAGPVYRKNGRWGSGTQVHDSAIYLMPRGVEMAIFVNSVPAGMAPVPSYLDPIRQFIIDCAELDFGLSIGP